MTTSAPASSTVTASNATSPSPSAPLQARADAALDTLLSRRSHWPLAEPAPRDAELDLIFDAAMRAPDHGKLRPWRFVVVRGEARGALGDVLVDVAASRTPDSPREAHAHRRNRAFAAPLVIALAASISHSEGIPEVEQVLALGAATMNMLNAIHALGYGGFWATGADSYDARVHDALGFADNERVLGFLFVGTPPETAAEKSRPPHTDYVREWSGATSAAAQ
ncbi:nitroreductase family protein [Paraburkholderia bannensis]|uniref:nitroreductase family protein n=1 Tax=Paraburkholderia bannensis TaxID=765414 RepID=UPI002AB6BF66|nr:nitroreductase [Paraburkholderia bannensis]